MRRVIHWEFCKKLKFDYTNKWYMYNPASVLENDTYKLLRDFGIHTGHLTSARRPNLIIKKKKEKTQRTCRIVDFADHRIKLKESEKKDKCQEPTRELKKTEEHESDGDRSCNWCSWYRNQRIYKRTEGHGNKRTSGDHPNYSIVEIG